MKRLTQSLPILLAALLQFMPLLRNIITSPATGSTMAIILRWGLGSSAALGAFDACSGATSSFTSTNKFNATVGTFFTNNLVVYIGGGPTAASSDYFFVKVGTNTSPLLSNGQSTTNLMPPGLTLRAFWTNGSTNMFTAIFGTPIASGSYTNTINCVSPGYATIFTNVTFTISTPLATPPVITNNPVGVTNISGANATFSVTAGGTAPLSYQWRFTSAGIGGATNSSLSLTNIRTSQAGNYTVVITNSAGAITSSVALLAVTNPLPQPITAPVSQTPGFFQFTFVPTVGLTNTVQVNNNLSSGAWTTFTNVPPPLTATPITVTDPLGSSNRYYRVQIIP